MTSKLFFLFLLPLLIACGKSSQPQVSQQNSTLVGKSLTLRYPNLTAEVSYPNDTTVHWKTTDAQGSVAEQTNPLTLRPLGDGRFFLSWIEDDGTTVSQVLNLKEKSVKAQLTYELEGKRVGEALEGSVEETTH